MRDLSKAFCFPEMLIASRSENAQIHQHLRLSSNSITRENVFINTLAMKETQPNGDASRKYPALTSPPGNEKEGREE